MMVENVHTEVFALNCLGRMCYLASTSRSTDIPLNDRIQSQTDGFFSITREAGVGYCVLYSCLDSHTSLG